MHGLTHGPGGMDCPRLVKSFPDRVRNTRSALTSPGLPGEMHPFGMSLTDGDKRNDK